MPLKQIIQIATIALDAGLIGFLIYYLRWSSREHLQQGN